MRQNLLGAGSFKSIKKIGFIVPSSNTVLEPITTLVASELAHLVSFHYARLRVTSVSLDANDVKQFQQEKMLDAARLLRDAGVDAIVWNGTSAGWSGEGFDADRAICEAIERELGVPASTTTLAQKEAFDALNISTYSLAVPYVTGPTDMMIKTYANEGYQGLSSAKLDITVNSEIGDTPFDEIRRLILASDVPESQSIMVGCTNLAGGLWVEELEKELGKPIFDSVLVTFWKALRMVGITQAVPGWGELLRSAS